MELPKIIAFKLTPTNKGTSVKYESIDVIPKEKVIEKIKECEMLHKKYKIKNAGIISTLKELLEEE